MDESTHEERLSKPLQTNNKQIKIAITFPTEYNRIFNVTSKNNKIYFAKSVNDKNGLIRKTIPPSAYELESVKKETKRIFFEQGHFTEVDYRSIMKPNFSTL